MKKVVEPKRAFQCVQDYDDNMEFKTVISVRMFNN